MQSFWRQGGSLKDHIINVHPLYYILRKPTIRARKCLHKELFDFLHQGTMIENID